MNTKNKTTAKNIGQQLEKLSSLANRLAFVRDRVSGNQEVADALVQLNFKHYELLENKNKTYELTKIYAEEFRSNPNCVPTNTLETHDDIAATFVSKNGFCIQDMPPSIKIQKKFQLMAVNENGLSLEDLWYFDDKDNTIELNNDKDVVMAALKNNPLSYRFASHDLKADLDVLKLAISSPNNIDWTNFIEDDLFYSPKVLALLMEYKPSKLIEYMESSKFSSGTSEHIRAVKSGVKDKPQKFFVDVFKKVSIKHPLGFFSLDSFVPYVQLIVAPLTAISLLELMNIPSIANQKDMSRHLTLAMEKRKLLELVHASIPSDTQTKKSRKVLGKTP